MPLGMHDITSWSARERRSRRNQSRPSWAGNQDATYGVRTPPIPPGAIPGGGARVSLAWMVPGAGIEPARDARPQRILSPMRLPVSPPRQKVSRRPAPGRDNLPSCRNQTTGVLTGGGDRIRTGAQGFAVLCLTTWLRRLMTTTGACADRPCPSHSGAGNGARTRDIHLGKVALYH